MVDSYLSGSIGHGLSQSESGRRHRGFVILASVVTILSGFVLPPLTLEQQFWIIAVPVGVFGLSHGGADPWILRQISGSHGRSAILGTSLYLLVSALFIGLIWFFPASALLVFLAISVWHFGYTDAAYLSKRHSNLLIMLSGSASIVGPILGHHEQTGQLFSWLIDGDSAAIIGILRTAGPVLAAIWVLGLGLLYIKMKDFLGRMAFLEMVLIAAAMVLLPPLVAFAFYFCLVHSSRHFISIAHDNASERRLGDQIKEILPRLLPATGIVIGVAFLAWYAIALLNPASDLLVEAFRVMFWGLAALTLPHSFMVRMWWKTPT